MDTQSDNQMKVLVVIDVQNCFMFHGDKVPGDTSGLNTTEEASKDIVDELETLVDGKTHIVFSRDFHPVNHISLEGYEGRTASVEKGIWPKHCRNKTLHCKRRINDGISYPTEEVENNFVDTETGKVIIHGTDEWKSIKTKMLHESIVKNQYLEVVGTELSYMFFTSEKLREPVKQLVITNRAGKSKIGLKDTTSESISGAPMVIEAGDETRKINYGKSLTYGDKKYISLTKGERCDKEAYSAFNYHIQYNPSDPYDAGTTEKVDNIPLTKENSTGLWDWILQNKTNDEITITVCGLVGNVCVMHSLLQGIALWNEVYSVENPGVRVKFVYSLKGTRFAPGVPPLKARPEFNEDVIDWFNRPFNRPTKMGTISVTGSTSSVEHSNKVTSFEVLGYNGEQINTGTFAFSASASGGRRRRHRSVRRTRNKSRKTTKRYKGRRTYKNKRRNTKRRI
jgi:nicotinamidase-related amidase